MNSPYVFTLKLQKLCILAKKANNDFEKASVFSATESLVLKFLKEDKLPGRVSEYIYLIRYHINASLGYDYAHGLTASDHDNQALIIANDLIDLIETMTEFDDTHPSYINNKVNKLMSLVRG
ncbi:hypothetical protein [Shewanella surugensis]|uniref:Tsi6 domain-containing protein n=1 Tax=Shewanella surugensis TaxID=212020 RepID=A0ABT0LI60_9GAMM|nr:hypothetical protein [Shewanella surugensis]MCL1127376.1 hypothetical protein [Shewanella surugensis]